MLAPWHHAAPQHLREGDGRGWGEEGTVGVAPLHFQVRLGLEPLFQKYGVDLYIAGHEHNYERMYV